MSKKEDDDSGLLIWGLICTFSGALYWIGIPLLVTYIVKRFSKRRNLNRNREDHTGLLTWGLILTCTGALAGIGIPLLIAYFVKTLSQRNFENNEMNYKTNATYENDNSNVKIVYAEKIETVNSKQEEIKVKEEVKTNKKDDYSVQEILEKLEYYENHSQLSNEEFLEKILILNKMLSSLVPKIDKEELQNDIKEINKIIDKILKALKNKKSKIKSINNFATYYLPVTLKILIKYDEVENLKLNTENSKEFMNTVEDKIKMIKTSFKNQLENLYVDDFDDVEAELNVLETMLKSDGYTDLDDFNLRKKNE